MKFGYSNTGSHYWVNFYNHIAKILPGNHTVSAGTNCDVFFYSYWNVPDSLKCRRGTKLVFISGECWDVSKFPCSLLIDCKYNAKRNNANSRFLYYPFYALSFFERPAGANEKNLIKSSSFDARLILAGKKRFCAFMYSYDVDFRVQLFDDVNAYKRVDALGKSRNPDFKKATSDRVSVSYLDNAVASYRPFKFVICCENQRAPGYVTEKIINAMLANAIPIYYGATDISDHFNPSSFINIGSFQSRKEAIRYIQQVDENDDLYCSMQSQPWFRNNTLPRYFNTKYLQDAFMPILNKSQQQPIKSSSPVHRRLNSQKSPIIQRKMQVQKSPMIQRKMQVQKHASRTWTFRRIYSERQRKLGQTRRPLLKLRKTSRTPSRTSLNTRMHRSK